jgi:hypothetical protein
MEKELDQKNPFGDKRYNAYSVYLKRRFGERVQKVTVDAGFTCPNRDGTVAVGGCTYCNNASFNPGYNSAAKSIRQQVSEGVEFLKRRYGTEKYFVYFQPYSNTYASLDRLKRYYEEALSIPEVIGLTIGTRPDCIDEQKVNYLEQLARSHEITIEYGLESFRDESLKKINRGHDFRSFVDAVEMTRGRGIRICTHIIVGFPWENKADWIEEAAVLSALPIDFLKIHQLHIVRDTVMEKQYLEGRIELLTFEAYLDVIVSFLEKLDRRIIIQRLGGVAPPQMLVAPKWGIRYPEMLQAIDERLETDDTWQGKFYQQADHRGDHGRAMER